MGQLLFPDKIWARNEKVRNGKGIIFWKKTWSLYYKGIISSCLVLHSIERKLLFFYLNTLRWFSKLLNSFSFVYLDSVDSLKTPQPLCMNNVHACLTIKCAPLSASKERITKGRQFPKKCFNCTLHCYNQKKKSVEIKR